MPAAPVLLPLAGEGGPRVSEGWMRGFAARATCGIALVPSIPHPALRATFSRKREKDGSGDWPMIVHRPPKQLGRAQAMRREPTKAEEIVWRSLRTSGLGVKFRRQVPIGPYVADFACLPAKLVVELDGPPHDKPQQAMRDRVRDGWFLAHGWQVVRVPNAVVFGGGDMVLERIKAALPVVPSSDPATPGHLLPQAGEGRAERT